MPAPPDCKCAQQVYAMEPWAPCPACADAKPLTLDFNSDGSSAKPLTVAVAVEQSACWPLRMDVRVVNRTPLLLEFERTANADGVFEIGINGPIHLLPYARGGQPLYCPGCAARAPFEQTTPGPVIGARYSCKCGARWKMVD